MNFELDETQQEIQRTARALLEARSPLAEVRAAAERGSYDDALWRELSELGWPGIAVAEEHGGQGLGFVGLCVLLEEAGYALAGAPLLASAVAAAAIQHAGTPEQREAWLPQLAAGTAKGTVAVASGGEAELVIDPLDAAVIVVVDDGVPALVTPGEGDVEPLATIDPTRRYGRLTVRDAEPMAEGDLAVLDLCRVAVAAELVGIAQRSLEMSVAYVKERQQFGKPVGAFQAVAHRCASMLRSTETARSAVYGAAWAVDADPAGVGEAAAIAKAAAGDAGREVTAAAIQLHGGIGFTWEADCHWFFKRAHVDALLFGTASDHRKRLARELARRLAAAAA